MQTVNIILHQQNISSICFPTINIKLAYQPQST